jgi:hypothetical protein
MRRELFEINSRVFMQIMLQNLEVSRYFVTEVNLHLEQ